MQTIRALVLAITVTCGMLLPLGSGSGIQQARAGHGHVQVRTYNLYYRVNAYYPWYWYGSTTNYQLLLLHANWIRSYGYEVYIY